MFFFFKQKTAYEMCGRDWSSDVCSSDLRISAIAAGEFEPSETEYSAGAGLLAKNELVRVVDRKSVV